MCVYVCSRAHAERSEVDVKYPMLSLSTLYRESGSLTEPGARFAASKHPILFVVHYKILPQHIHQSMTVASGDCN